jgi:hypothetical protein
MKDEKVETSKFDDDFLIPEDIEVEDVTNLHNKESQEAYDQRKRKKAIKKRLSSAGIMIVLSGFIFGIGLLWQNDTSLLAITDALWLVVVMEFFIGWTMFVYNMNIFSSIIFSTKSFFLMLVGKKPKLDYYSYTKKIEDDPVPSYYYKVLFLSTFILLIPAVSLLFILT